MCQDINFKTKMSNFKGEKFLLKIMINIQVFLYEGNIFFCLSQHTLPFLNFSHHIFDSRFSNFDSSLKVILTAE